MKKQGSGAKAWVVAADMGYGHLRAVYPLLGIAEEGIISIGSNDGASPAEKKLWTRLLAGYGFFSRARGIPVIGKPVFNLLDTLLRIPSFYPIRDLSKSTMQVDLLASSIRKGLCSGMLEKVRTKRLPLVTSFFAPAIAADMNGYEKVYCIICDADLNRVWVAKEPSESKIYYCAPCGKAAQRLKAYGVPEERIYLTGFPLPQELLGGDDLEVLRSDLTKRLENLDPGGRFHSLHGPNVEHFLGPRPTPNAGVRPLTITYSIGGAGAQKEIGRRIAFSLKEKLAAGNVRVNLCAGIKPGIKEYFEGVRDSLGEAGKNISVLAADGLEEYFRKFNLLLRETDILWTKPSELSFYCALGIPIIMTPTIGSQEKFNRQWLLDIQAGIRQENPDYTHQWLFDFLEHGRLAEAAWSGFLKARKLGTKRILEILERGEMTRVDSPLRS